MSGFFLRLMVLFACLFCLLFLILGGIAKDLPTAGQIVFTYGHDNERVDTRDLYWLDVNRRIQQRLTYGIFGEYQPDISPGDYQILFVSRMDGEEEIYVMAADGSNIRQLTHNESKDEFPAWSPDGTQIAFQSERAGGTNLFVMNADGSHIRQLTDSEGFDGEPSWSPDGTQIAFDSNRTGRNEIHVMNVDGSNERALTTSLPYLSKFAAWSPDGSQIAFASRSTGDIRISWDIFIMNADGSNIRRVTADPAHNSQYPFWSPDSRQIIYESPRETGWWWLHQADATRTADRDDTTADEEALVAANNYLHRLFRPLFTDPPLDSGSVGFLMGAWVR